MSLILEALRKSEAERRRGQAPGLHAELPPAAPSRRMTLSAWPWLAVAAVIVFALAWWLQHRPTRVAAPARTQAADAAATADAGTPPRPAGPAFAATHPQPPLRARATSPAAPAPPAPAVARPEAYPAALPAPVSSPSRASTALPAAQAPPGAPVAAPSASTVLPAPLPADGGVPTIQSLPADQRKALPPLKLTMHLWDELPAQRFVILDGQRLGEGGRIGELVVDTIEPDAVLFDWNGRKLRLPLR